MAIPQRPFTPESLAERWAVSDELVRQLCHQNKLRAFRVGRMFRIPVEAVEDYEACQTIGLEGSTDDS